MEMKRPIYKGRLNKRQRGRRQNADLMNLKFQTRHCILYQDRLDYYETKLFKRRKGQFSVKDIAIVEKVPDKIFSRHYCFQIGNEREMMYFVAQSESDREGWIYMLRTVANHNKNQMLSRYHMGVFGQSDNLTWSCCNRPKDVLGCCRTTGIFGSFNRRSTRRSTRMSISLLDLSLRSVNYDLAHSVAWRRHGSQNDLLCDTFQSEELLNNNSVDVFTQTSFTTSLSLSGSQSLSRPTNASNLKLPSASTPSTLLSHDKRFIVVIHGVEESPQHANRHAHDVQSVTSNFHHLDPKINESCVCNCTRLGKYNSTRNRTLLITLTCTSNVSSILANKYKLASSPFTNISIKHYMTRKERSVYSILLTERRKLIRDGFNGKIRIKGKYLLVNSTKYGKVEDSSFRLLLTDPISPTSANVKDSDDQQPSILDQHTQIVQVEVMPTH